MGGLIAQDEDEADGGGDGDGGVLHQRYNNKTVGERESKSYNYALLQYAHILVLPCVPCPLDFIRPSDA